MFQVLPSCRSLAWEGLWPDCSLPQRQTTPERCTAPTEQQAEAGWPENPPIKVVLRIPNQGLFFLPCYLQAAWRFESTTHFTCSFSASKIGLALTAPSSSLLAPCPCVSDGSSDPGMILFLFLPIPRAWRQLCLKHNTTAPREKCLPYHLCPSHSLLKRTNILYKRRTERTHHSVRVVMKKDLSNTNKWISTLPGGPVWRFLLGLWVLRLVFQWIPSWQVWLCDLGQ